MKNWCKNWSIIDDGLKDQAFQNFLDSYEPFFRTKSNYCQFLSFICRFCPIKLKCFLTIIVIFHSDTHFRWLKTSVIKVEQMASIFRCWTIQILTPNDGIWVKLVSWKWKVIWYKSCLQQCQTVNNSQHVVNVSNFAEFWSFLVHCPNSCFTKSLNS